ncbi:helix-turn-helix domain-containing protein [Halobacteriaceae archaeon GCM10025711]
MAPGIRAEIEVGQPGVCQVAPETVDAGEATAVVKSRPAEDGGEIAEEFTLEGTTASGDMDELFSYGDRTVYRFSREGDQGCVCDVIEHAACPVRDVRAAHGRLLVTFLAPDIETLRSVVTDLKAAYSDIHVRRLTRSECEESHDRLVVVDRDDLTPRQEEVLTTAHRMGYFTHPKEANAGEVAAALGIATPTFTEHLAAAQSKLLDALLDP